MEWYLYGNVAYALLCKLINVRLKQTYKDAAVSCYSLTIHKFDLVSMTGLHVATSWVLSTDAYLVSSSHDLSYEELKYYTSLFTKCYNVKFIAFFLGILLPSFKQWELCVALRVEILHIYFTKCYNVNNASSNILVMYHVHSRWSYLGIK